MRYARLAPLVAAALLATAGLASAAPKPFTIDPAHSEVGFNIRHFFSKVHGRFEKYDGLIQFDDKDLAASSVDVTIADSSINTQNSRRDNHLRSSDFFDAAKFPSLAFKSTKVVPGKDASHFQIQGDLTMHGVTKPVTLDVEYLGMAPLSMGGRAMGTHAGFSASVTVDRKDYGILWNKTLDNGSLMLGDDVEIVLNIDAIQKE